ncbi:MAG: hypothetical protein RL701_4031, partial [Pseudomonadota bacterium]
MVLVSGLWCAACSESVRLDLFAPEPATSADAGAVGDAATDAGVIVNRDAGPSMPPRDASQDARVDPTSDDAGGPASDTTRASLVLRYDFKGRGTRLSDRVGSATARVLGGAQLDETGGLTLDGIDDYIDLPNRTLAHLQSATLMTWVTWSGGICWQRVFDFGRSTQGEDNPADGLASLFLTFATCPEGTLRASYEQSTTRFPASSDRVAPTEEPMQLTLVFDAARARMTLYLNGLSLGDGDVPYALSELDDNNAWLGRSQWQQDSFARARFD